MQLFNTINDFLVEKYNTSIDKVYFMKLRLYLKNAHYNLYNPDTNSFNSDLIIILCKLYSYSRIVKKNIYKTNLYNINYVIELIFLSYMNKDQREIIKKLTFNNLNSFYYKNGITNLNKFIQDNIEIISLGFDTNQLDVINSKFNIFCELLFLLDFNYIEILKNITTINCQNNDFSSFNYNEYLYDSFNANEILEPLEKMLYVFNSVDTTLGYEFVYSDLVKLSGNITPPIYELNFILHSIKNLMKDNYLTKIIKYIKHNGYYYPFKLKKHFYIKSDFLKLLSNRTNAYKNSIIEKSYLSDIEISKSLNNVTENLSYYISKYNNQLIKLGASKFIYYKHINYIYNFMEYKYMKYISTSLNWFSTKLVNYNIENLLFRIQYSAQQILVNINSFDKEIFKTFNKDDISIVDMIEFQINQKTDKNKLDNLNKKVDILNNNLYSIIQNTLNLINNLIKFINSILIDYSNSTNNIVCNLKSVSKYQYWTNKLSSHYNEIIFFRDGIIKILKE